MFDEGHAYNRRVCFEVKVVGFNKLTDDALQGISHVGCLSSSNILECDVDVQRVAKDNVIQRRGIEGLVPDCGLKWCPVSSETIDTQLTYTPGRV